GPVRDDQGGDVRSTLADDQRPVDQRILREAKLDRLRRDVLADGRLEQRLLAVGDLQEAVAVDLSDVARGDPAVDQRLGGGLRVLVIAEHVARALHEDLAVVRDLYLYARARLAHGQELVVGQRVRARAR